MTFKSLVLKMSIQQIDTDDELKVNETNLLGIDWITDRANIILSGQTWSGKTTLLQNILKESILSTVDPWYIYIFSKTAKIDLSYWPLIMYLMKNTTGKLKIYDSIDMEVIKSIVNG